MLSPEEKAELEALRREQGPMNQGSLSPAEKAELEQLRAEQDGPKQEAKPEGAGFVERGVTGAVQTLPFGAALMNKAQGRDAYSGGFDGTMQKVGDASNAALTALTLGKGMGAGAALGAGLEASGISPALRKGGEWLEKSYEPKSQSVGVNMMANLPAYVGSVLMNLAPALLASKMRIPEKKPVAAIDPAIQARAQFAQAEGIPLTKGETMGRTSPAAIKEAGFRKSPGGEQASLGMQTAQQAAIKESLAKRAGGLGDDVLAGEIRQGSGMTEGRQLADVPDAARDIRSQRGQAVGDAKAALSQEIPIRSNFGKELSGVIDSTMSKVEGAMKGSNRAKVADILDSVRQQARSVKTMKQAIDFLDDLDSTVKGVFDRDAPNVQKVYLGELRKKVMNVLDEAGTQLAPEAQGNLKTAKAGFAEVADPAQGLRKMEDMNPSAMLRQISGGGKSLDKVQGFNKVFEKGSQQRQGLKSALIQDVIKKGTQKEGVSGSAMARALDKIDQSTLNEIFSDSPKELADFRGFVKGLSDIEGQRTPLGTVPSGNSQTAALLQAVGSVANLKLPGASWLMQKLTNYRSGKAFKPYALKAEKIKAEGGGVKAARNLQSQYGINPLMFSKVAAGNAQAQ